VLVCERIDDEYGLDVPALFILNVSLPAEVEKALDARTSMNVIGDLGRYQQFQVGNALGAPGSGARAGLGEGIGLGAGLALGQQLLQGSPGAAAAPPLPGAPPPLPSANVLFHVSQAGQSQGPFPLQQLIAGIGQGQLNAATMVWSPGMAGWLPAAQVPALAGYFAAPPPPPPR
jgi:hypothetical protein